LCANEMNKKKKNRVPDGSGSS
ncbi:hypothetical protein EE612_007970, partial [Oryza sativa]